MAARFEPGNAEAFVRVVEELQGAAEIILQPGVFSLPHPLDISHPLTLIGAGPDNTVIDCAAEGWVMRFLAGPCSVRGIHFAHLGELVANVVIAGSAFDIRDCRFTGGICETGQFGGAGIFLIGESVGRVVGCDASANQTGIATVGSTATLQGNRCFENRDDGIYVYESECTLRRNRCERNQGDGIYISDSVVTLTGNESLENVNRGVHILGSTKACLEENSCISNGAAGLEWRGTSSGTAAGNHVRRNDFGINLLETCAPVLEGNTVTENTRTGINAQDESRVTLRKNNVSANGFSGLQLRNSASARVEENSFRDNARFGIALFESTTADILNNTCTGNQSSGILLDENATAELTANVCSHNQQNGARIEGSARLLSRSNQYDDNAETGLIITADANFESHGDSCRRNRATGVALGADATATLNGLHAEENQIFGAHFSGDGEANCAAVTASSNGSSGFYVVQNRRLRFQECTARGNGGSGYHLGGEAHNLIDCVSDSNQECGILANGASELVRNTVAGNVHSGVMVCDSVVCTVLDSRLAENQQHGIAFSGDSTGAVRNSYCGNNGKNGIGVWGTAAPQLIGNQCMDNAGTGITCSDHAHPTIENNLLSRNKLGGIGLLDQAGGIIASNQITGNFGPGIYAADRSAPHITGNTITLNVGSILTDAGAKATISGNHENSNNLPDPASWTVVGSRNGKHVDYKQFAAAAAVPLEPAVFLERAAKSLHRMGWAAVSNVMLPHPETGGYMAEFRLKTQSGMLNLTAIGLIDGGAAQLNVSFSDSSVVMWLNQQSEHIVAQTLYGMSTELSDLTNRKNPWVCLHGDWTSDMSFRDAANQPYHVWSARRH